MTLDLDPDVEQLLQDQARISGESLDTIVNRTLAAALRASEQAPRTFVIVPFALDMPEKWKGLTPTQILYEMDEDGYMQKSERARHESAAVRL